MFYVYILKSLKSRKSYTGHTDNLKRRIVQHNSGLGAYSHKFAPWELIHRELFDSQEDAIKREKYLKSAVGRKWIKKQFQKFFE
ncbi:MAG: GIY-YIG nuclease family protein [Patescibacteria group bacterium]